MKNYYNVLPPTKTDHPLTLASPLYNLPDGVRDELDALTGVETHRLGVKVFDGTEDIIKFTHAATGVIGFQCAILDAALVEDSRLTVMSTHFKGQIFISLYSGTAKGIAQHFLAHALYFYHTPFDDYSKEDVKAWMAAEKAAGTPVTVVYELAEAVTHNNDPLTIPLYPPNCSIGVNDGKMDVEYLSGGEVVAKSGNRINLLGVDAETDLQKCVVYGVGEQEGTPTPDAPVPIPALSDAVVTVGDVQSVRINRKGKRTFHL